MIRAISLTIIASAFLCLVGWTINESMLTSVVPNGIPMRSATAIMFILSAVSLLKYEQNGGHWRSLTISSIALSAISYMAVLHSLWFLSNDTIKISSIWVSEDGMPFGGQPSSGTLVCFGLFAAAGWMGLISGKAKLFRSIGVGICIVGSVALIGHLVGVPDMYWEVPYKNIGMAINSSVLFILLGFGMFLTKKH